MNVILQYQRELFSSRDGHKIGGTQVVVKSGDYAVLEYYTATKMGYQNACRFMRLLERGYSPCAARWISIMGANSKWVCWDKYVDLSAHDRLTDEIAPFVPEGFSMDYFSIDELAKVELDAVFQAWQDDGPRALFEYEDEFLVPYQELRDYVTGRAQGEDELQGNWVVSHHTSNYSY